MPDLLLDTDIVIDICMSDEDVSSPALQAIRKCEDSNGRVWLYVGSVCEMEQRLTRRILDERFERQEKGAVEEAGNLAKASLKTFAEGKRWLAALSGEGEEIFASQDIETEQYKRALERFSLSEIYLLTTNERSLSEIPYAITPQKFLELPVTENKIAFVDLATQQDLIRPGIERNIHRVLYHGKYIMGPEVTELESQLAAYVGTKECISVSSGTDALLVALMALGIGAGDEVITTPFTFIATAEVIALLGAKPVFVDIDPLSYNMDPDRIEEAITDRTRAIVPVSLYGQCADVDKINDIAGRYELPVIEDGAQSFGATYKGRRSCGLTTIGCTSFFPSKPLGVYGDGGACFTNDPDLAEQMRRIRVHGQVKRYCHSVLGINGRMDALQAAVLLEKIKVFPEEIEKRQRVACRYTRYLRDRVRVPIVEEHNSCVYAQYTIQVEDRESVQAALNKKGIPTAVHYPVPLNHQAAISRFIDKRFDLPVSDAVAKRVISLPMHPYLECASQDRVIQELLSCLPEDSLPLSGEKTG